MNDGGGSEEKQAELHRSEVFNTGRQGQFFESFLHCGVNH